MCLRWTLRLPIVRSQHAAPPGHCEDASAWAGASGLGPASQPRRENESVRGWAEHWTFPRKPVPITFSQEINHNFAETVSTKASASSSAKWKANYLPSRLLWGLNELASTLKYDEGNHPELWLFSSSPSSILNIVILIYNPLYALIFTLKNHFIGVTMTVTSY